jgi:Domain of unknown function (DUF4160)
MPEISRFFGLVIRMYFLDHAPPHFHASYGDHEAVLGISPPRLLTGQLPRRALALATEWATLHEAALLFNWRRLRANQSPVRVPPLE